MEIKLKRASNFGRGDKKAGTILRVGTDLSAAQARMWVRLGYAEELAPATSVPAASREPTPEELETVQTEEVQNRMVDGAITRAPRKTTRKTATKKASTRKSE